MTNPSEDQELQAAHREADRAIELARSRRKAGLTLAERWRQSREDNNFRAMLRALAGGEDQ